MKRHAVSLDVNGEVYEIEVEPRRTLADALRDDCRLTGTHLGCEHGVCGACTVLVEGEPVRSCLLFAVQCSAKSVRTVEGLADGTEPNLLQRTFWDKHALQCGFCTPGFLMLATAMLESDQLWTEATVREALSSNLCRCTGYANIVEAVSGVLKAEGRWASEPDQPVGLRSEP